MHPRVRCPINSFRFEWISTWSRELKKVACHVGGCHGTITRKAGPIGFRVSTTHWLSSPLSTILLLQSHDPQILSFLHKISLVACSHAGWTSLKCQLHLSLKLAGNNTSTCILVTPMWLFIVPWVYLTDSWVRPLYFPTITNKAWGLWHCNYRSWPSSHFWVSQQLPTSDHDILYCSSAPGDYVGGSYIFIKGHASIKYTHFRKPGCTRLWRRLWKWTVNTHLVICLPVLRGKECWCLDLH